MSAHAPRPGLRLAERARLVAGLAGRDIVTRYAGSYLGIVWAFAVPLLSSAVYILVFGMLMRGTLMGETYKRFDFTTFYFLGFAPWLLFAEVVSRATSLLRENRNLVRNVRFEHQLLPLVIFASASISHGVVLLLALALVLFHGYGLGPHIYLLPFFYLVLLLFTVGIAYALAAFSAYLSDLGQIVPIFLNLYFFACPVLYTPQLVEQMGGPVAKTLMLDLNPMARIIEGYRVAFLDVPSAFGPGALLLMLGGSLLVLLAGAGVYGYLRKGFADVL